MIVLGGVETMTLSGDVTVDVPYCCIIGCVWYRNDASLASGNFYFKTGSVLTEIIKQTNYVTVTANSGYNVTISLQSSATGQCFVYPHI